MKYNLSIRWASNINWPYTQPPTEDKFHPKFTKFNLLQAMDEIKEDLTDADEIEPPWPWDCQTQDQVDSISILSKQAGNATGIGSMKSLREVLRDICDER